MFPEEYREDPESPSEAERILYRALQEQLPDEYVVFHRRPWHAPNAQGSARDGEADFVIAHEEKGILVVEAKSGGVARDVKSGRWHAVDHDGRRTHDLDDPIQQAMRCQKALVRRLKELPAGARRWWTVGHAVAFPHIAFDVDLFEATPEIVLDRRSLPRLRDWTERAMAHWQDRERHEPLGEDGMTILASLLAVGFELRPLSGSITEQEMELARLTNEQFRVLDGLARFRRALICGCAGSGKTMLALEKVRRLAEQGLRPLYVCFNRQLRDSCRRFLEPWPSATVDNFHGLCERFVKRAGMKVERTDDEEYFERALPEALAEAAKSVPERYDAIVVDEGQDFQPHWWGPLQSALRDGRRGVLTIFYDDNQMLYADELVFPRVDTQYDLTENCRNVRRIHELVTRWYKSGRTITSRASRGPAPVIRTYARTEELLESVEKALDELTRVHRVVPQDIAVLTGHGKERSAVWRARRFGKFTLGEEIFWSSVHAFKGLERAAVVLAEIEPLSHAELGTILYVGCSRARIHLVVIASEAAGRLAGLKP